MLSMGKITAGIAGAAGTGNLGVTLAALIRPAAAHVLPTGIWIVLAVLSSATVLIAGLGLVLDYRRGRLELGAQAEEQKTRLEMYQTLVEKASGEPGNASSYRDLILADALHLAVEQGAVQPADQTHLRLYATRDPSAMSETKNSEVGPGTDVTDTARGRTSKGKGPHSRGNAAGTDDTRGGGR